VLQGTRILDLTEPDPMNTVHREVVGRLTARFRKWTCRYSGEPRDAWSFLEAGDLYHYETDPERWRALFQVALDEMGFHAIRVIDVSDGLNAKNEPRRIWVTQRADLVRRASPGEELVQRLAQCPWEDTQAWIEANLGLGHLAQRARALAASGRALTLEEVGGAPDAGPTAVWRATDFGGVRPGDHVRLGGGPGQCERTGTARLPLVHPGDLVATQSDDEFVYLPQAWRQRAGATLHTYLQSLDGERLRMLVDGETHRLLRHQEAIARLKQACTGDFPAHLAHGYHGPQHWLRVSDHAVALARSLGIDPLVPCLFGMVHDSQRWDDGIDPEHGERAAEFIRAHREELFGFLADHEVQDLAVACALHSHGVTEGSPTQRACWDADRLDLGRVGVRPHPRYLCTDYGRRADVIQTAWNLSTACTDHFGDDEQGLDDPFEELGASEAFAAVSAPFTRRRHPRERHAP